MFHNIQIPYCLGAEDLIKAKMINQLQGGNGGESAVFIPQVQRTSKDGSRISSDPFSTLLNKANTVFLHAAFDDAMASVITSSLLTVDNRLANTKLENTEINLYINSPGGVVTAGLSIIDTMDFCTADVSTLVMGQAASMGAATLVAGAQGKRYALPRARIMVHQIRGGAQGTLSDMTISMDEAHRLNEILKELFIERTGQSRSTIDEWFSKDTWFTPEEAKKVGIIDDVITPKQLKQMASQSGDN